jgi:hypothetical protein
MVANGRTDRRALLSSEYDFVGDTTDNRAPPSGRTHHDADAFCVLGIVWLCVEVIMVVGLGWGMGREYVSAC